MTIRVRSSYALVAGLLCMVPAAGLTQAPRALVGLVRDSAGHAIPLAEVSSRENIIVARSDDSGRFHVSPMPEGARGVFVRRLGFKPQRALIPLNAAGTTDSVVVTLVAVVTELPSMTATARHDSISRRVLAEFWARRARGFGRFITRDEIEQRGSVNFVDLMRRMPGAMVQNQRGLQEVRFGRSGLRDCQPQYWVDGIPIERGSAGEFTPNNLEAIELYSGPATTPPQYTTRGPTCGTIIIWTRLPG
ncbi:MAG: TonB-dependent receptor plug domain-containing protein [Gemmatimonadaceae bacterium]